MHRQFRRQLFDRGTLHMLLMGSLLLLFLVQSSATAQKPKLEATASPQAALGSGFTYQGRLKNSSGAINGACDLAFRLFDDPVAGLEVTTPITQTINVNNGLFTTSLDFGSFNFKGQARFLDTMVSCPSGSGTFTQITPRQELAAVPYALFALDTTNYQNVIVVAKSGGDFTSIAGALTSLPFGTATANNRFLVWVAPGVYNEAFSMVEFIDVQGAGQGVTVITSAGTTTIQLTRNTKLSHLSVVNTSVSGSSHVLRGPGSGGPTTSVTLDHVTIESNGAGGTKHTALEISNSPPTIIDSTISVSGAATNEGVILFTQSTVRNTTINVSGTGTSTNRAVTVGGGIVGSTVTLENVTVNVTSASGSTINEGVKIVGGGGTLKGLIVNVSGAAGSINRGVTANFNTTLNTVNIRESTVKVSGGSAPRGIEVTQLGTLIVDASRVEVSNGGGNEVGISASTTSTTTTPCGINVNSSQIKSGIPTTGASSLTVSNSGKCNIRIGTSQLDGGPTVDTTGTNQAGTIKCAGIYDSNYNFLASTCPAVIP